MNVNFKAGRKFYKILTCFFAENVILYIHQREGNPTNRKEKKIYEEKDFSGAGLRNCDSCLR